MEKLGLTADFAYDRVEIVKDSVVYAEVGEDIMYDIGTNFGEFGKLEKYKQEILYHLLIEYSSTPIEEREDNNSKGNYVYNVYKYNGMKYEYLKTFSTKQNAKKYVNLMSEGIMDNNNFKITKLFVVDSFNKFTYYN